MAAQQNPGRALRYAGGSARGLLIHHPPGHDRVIRAVEGGVSRNAAARRFGVSIASAVRWMDAYLRSGRTAAKPRGGDRRSARIEAQADLLLGAIEETPDITPAKLRERLIAERGETFAISTIYDFYRRRGVTYKKRPRTPASRSATK